jgi:hypothetical protein
MVRKQTMFLSQIIRHTHFKPVSNAKQLTFYNIGHDIRLVDCATNLLDFDPIKFLLGGIANTSIAQGKLRICFR